MPTPINVKFYKLDAIAFLKSLDHSSVDLIITDPAYKSLEKHRKIGTTTRLKEKWFDIFPNERFPEFFDECFRVLKWNSHFYFICDAETMFFVKPIAENAGFKFWKPIVWDKVNIGMGYHYRSRCEFVLFFEKGKRRLNSQSTPDVLQFARPSKRDRYPTEKPKALIDVLIEQSSDEGDLVIDPFFGSGVVAISALTHARSFSGSDTSEDALLMADERFVSTVNAMKGDDEEFRVSSMTRTVPPQIELFGVKP